MALVTGLLLAAAVQCAQPAATAPPTPKPAPARAAIQPTELDDLRGGDSSVTTAITDQTLNAVNSGNSVNGQTIGSGQINVGERAFDGFAGIGNFAINTGHNNNLQSTVSVTVNITALPAP